MRFGVIRFPGSCDEMDALLACRRYADAELLWHGDRELRGVDAVVVPGGFSYGDYLRAGALASLSPLMGAVKRHAEAGGLVLGVCNGFQILLEAGLLPGAMRRNQNLRFLCRDVHLRVERNDLPFTRGFREGQVLRMPIAHAEGNYEDEAGRLDALEANRQVVFRYVTPEGERADGDPQWNPNGAARAIAGIVNEGGNVLGMMPHPERCSEPILGNTDGLALFEGVVKSATRDLLRAGMRR